MAMRHFWFFIGFIVAGLGAGVSPDIIPSLLDRISTGVLPSVYVDAFNDPLPRLAGAFSTGALILFILVFAGLAFLDGLGIMLTRRQIREEQEIDAGSLAPEAFIRIIARHTPFEPAARIHARNLRAQKPQSGKAGSKSLKYVAASPARTAFDAKHTVEPFLYRWFFDPLPGLLAGTGAVMLGLSVLWALNSPDGDGFVITTLQPGIIALVMLSGTAIAIAALKRAILTLRRQQAAWLCMDIDGLYPPLANGLQIDDAQSSTQMGSADVVKAVSKLSNDLGKTIDARLKDWQETSETANAGIEKAVAAGIEETLREPLARLTAAAERSAETQTEQSKEALEAVLDSFLKRFDEHFGDQFQTFRSTLEETRQAAEALDESYRASLEDHRKQLVQDLSAHADSFERTAANFEALQSVLENLITLISPMMRQIVDNQESLLNALDQEASASKVISRAATELSTAAQASRDTVERFITLAERLRETSKAMGGTPNAPIDPGTISELRALRSSFLEDTPSSGE